MVRAFRNLDDLKAKLCYWLDTVANPKARATTRRIIAEAFAKERLNLRSLPLVPFRSVLELGRRISREGIVSLSGNF